MRFVPYQPRSRLGDSLAAADVHLTALRPELEGLIVPSKIYGILAAGRPTVHLGDPEGEVGQILQASESGFTIAPDDAGALARTLRRLHGDASLRARLGRRARAVFLDRFEHRHAMADWDEVLA